MNSFGSIELLDGSTPQTILDYPRPLRCFSMNGVFDTHDQGSLSVQPDAANDRLLVGLGDYLLNFDVAGEVSDDVATVTLHARVNGEETGIGCDLETLGTADAHLSMNGILRVTADDVGDDGVAPVEIYLEAETNESSSSSSSSSNSSSSSSSSSLSESESSSSLSESESSSSASSSSASGDLSSESSSPSSSSQVSGLTITPRHANLFLMRLDAGAGPLGHAGIVTSDNSAGQALSTAPAVLNCFSANGAGTSQTQGNTSLTPDVASDRIRVGAPGVYLARFSGTGSCSGADATIKVRLRQGGGSGGPATSATVETGGSEVQMSFSTIVRVTNDQMSGGYCNLDLTAESSTGTPTLTMRFGQFTAMRLR